VNGIADYEFIRSLGSGNHGEFFLAARPRRLAPVVDAEQVAVKVVVGESTEATFRRATRELQAFAAVSSPYLVRLFDAGQQDGVFYYAMEYLPGGSLAEPAKPVDQPTAIRAVADAARAVAALHTVGIVHRDIKPGNILLHEGGAKLSDLGLSQVFLPGVTITGMGSLASVEYLDPALLSGEHAAIHHDVYALGVTLHRAVAGHGVYGEDLPSDGLLALRRMLSQPPAVHQSVAPHLASVIASCLGPAPSRPSAQALADALAGVAASTSR
jgi:serine/threonine protein kinase